jgi:hypothetical protein
LKHMEDCDNVDIEHKDHWLQHTEWQGQTHETESNSLLGWSNPSNIIQTVSASTIRSIFPEKFSLHSVTTKVLHNWNGGWRCSINHIKQTVTQLILKEVRN